MKDAKGYLLYDFISTVFREGQIYKDGKQISGYHRLRRTEHEGETQGNLKGDESSVW